MQPVTLAFDHRRWALTCSPERRSVSSSTRVRRLSERAAGVRIPAHWAVNLKIFLKIDHRQHATSRSRYCGECVLDFSRAGQFAVFNFTGEGLIWDAKRLRGEDDVDTRARRCAVSMAKMVVGDDTPAKISNIGFRSPSHAGAQNVGEPSRGRLQFGERAGDGEIPKPRTAAASNLEHAGWARRRRAEPILRPGTPSGPSDT